MKVVLVTGGFDPVHSGHIAYFNAAKKLGDLLVVGLNSDAWLARKRGQAFMPLSERSTIIQNLKMVDAVIAFNDSDDTAIAAIQAVKKTYADATIVFANGGDRTADNIPEMIVNDVEFVFGVGGDDKKNSSRWILDAWRDAKVERSWGHYTFLYKSDNVVVKSLIVEPHSSLSMQRHRYRSEYWHVVSGRCTVRTQDVAGTVNELTLKQHDNIMISTNQWHQLSNPYDTACTVIEIQHGAKCDEQDIQRQ